MANNIQGPAPNAIVAKTTATFASVGLTALNTEIVYKIGAALQSWVPGRAINGISGFEAGKGYYLVAKVDMDLEAYVLPPLSGLVQLETPANFTATPSSTSQINLSWDAVTDATGYVIDRATNVGFTTGVALGIYSGNGTSFNDSGRTSATQYFYRIRATGAGFWDSNYATSNATTLSGSGLVDITFPTQTNLTNASGVWTGAGATFSDNKGVSTQKLAAGTNGYVQLEFDSTNGNNALLGFSSDATNADYSAGNNALMYFDTSGGTYRIDSGNFINEFDALSDGDLVKIQKTGTTYTLEKSTNGGSSWTVLRTFSGYHNNADQYIHVYISGAGNKAYNPKGSNII